MNDCRCCGVDFVIEDPPLIQFSIGGVDESLEMELSDPVIRTGIYPIYDGPVTVVSRIGEEQTLETALHTLMDDITVGRIPVVETSNPYGGNTVVIG